MTSRINDKPSLSDLLDQHLREVLFATNCHGVATVQKFDADNQTVTATMNYKRTQLKLQTNGQYIPEEIPYPVMVDCPVMVLRGGDASLTLPIKKGDTCLVLFNDRDLDAWFESGQLQAPRSNRLHSFTDAMVIVGISHSLNSLDDYDETRAALNHGDAKIAVGGALLKKILLTSNKNNPAASLGFILDVFMTACSGSSTDPVLAAAAAAAKIQLALLLE